MFAKYFAGKYFTFDAVYTSPGELIYIYIYVFPLGMLINTYFSFGTLINTAHFCLLTGQAPFRDYSPCYLPPAPPPWCTWRLNVLGCLWMQHWSGLDSPPDWFQIWKINQPLLAQLGLVCLKILIGATYVYILYIDNEKTPTRKVPRHTSTYFSNFLGGY